MGQTTGSSDNANEIPSGITKPVASGKQPSTMDKLAKGLLGGLGQGLSQYGQQNQNQGQNKFFGGY